MKNKIIAVDFDGTLCKNEYPNIGKPNDELINHLKRVQSKGDKLILWTCRVGDKLKDAVDWCKEKGLIFDSVNENLPEIIEEFGSDTRKIFANEYIDDKAINEFSLPFGTEFENVSDSFLVGVDFTRNKDVGVLVVGYKKMNESVDIVNAFQGIEAWNLYKKLSTSRPGFIRNQSDLHFRNELLNKARRMQDKKKGK